MNSLWKMPDYRHWFISDTTDVVATSLRLFAIPLVIISMTKSEFISGIVVTLVSVTTMIATPIGGAIADRRNRRRMMMLLGVIGASLSVIAVILICVGNQISTWMFIGIVIFFALNSGLLCPSNNAILKSIVPVKLFAKSQAIRETRESCVGILSGAVGGFFYRLSPWGPFAACGVMHIISAISAKKLSNPTVSVEDNEDESFIESLKNGFVWVMSSSRFRSYLAFGAVCNIACTGIIIGTQLMLAARGTDPILIGLIDGVMGIVMLLGSLCAMKITETLSPGLIATLTVVLFGISLVPMIFTDNYYVILACVSLGGFLFPACNSSLLGFLYGHTPNNMQGRADSVMETVLSVFSSFTPALVGWILESPSGFTGVVILCVTCSAVSMLITLGKPLRSIPQTKFWDTTTL
ncbi:permease [Bifidobacterium parmae]|uniref:Permease n=2 Tax=Bifidobacterium TaxID=1678 RepID=A0A2N5J6C5_9BIFI|nr:permease [Bifidobacterium parmae]